MSKKNIKKCAMCKVSIDIQNPNEDLLFFDNKFYHKKCYLESNEIRKKCKQCGNEIVYSGESHEEFVYYDDRFYHSDCFDLYCNATKSKSKKREFAKEHKDEYIALAKEKLSNQLNKKMKNESIEALQEQARKEVNRILNESKVNQYIRDNYNVSTVSGSIWRSLSSVYSGTHKKTEIPIPPEHLLDMWKRKQGYLNKQHQKALIKNDLSNEGRVLWDIVILISKYNSYLSWLNEKEQIENDTQNRKSENNKIHLPNPKQYIHKQNVSSNTEDDIDSVLDDIFGDC